MFWKVLNQLVQLKQVGLINHLIHNYTNYLNTQSVQNNLHILFKIQMYIYLLDLQGHGQLHLLKQKYSQLIELEKEKEKEEKEKEEKEKKKEEEEEKEKEEKEKKKEEEEVWEVKIEQSKVKIQILMEQYSYKKGEIGRMLVKVSEQDVFDQMELVFNIKEYNQKVEIGEEEVRVEMKSDEIGVVELECIRLATIDKRCILVVEQQQLVFIQNKKWEVKSDQPLEVDIQHVCPVSLQEIVHIDLVSTSPHLHLNTLPSMQVHQRLLMSSVSPFHRVRYTVSFNKPDSYTLQVMAHKRQIICQKTLVVHQNLFITQNKKQLELTSKYVPVQIQAVYLNNQQESHVQPFHLGPQEVYSIVAIQPLTLNQVKVIWNRSTNNQLYNNQLYNNDLNNNQLNNNDLNNNDLNNNELTKNEQELDEWTSKQEIIVGIDKFDDKVQKAVEVEYIYEGIQSIEETIRLEIRVKNLSKRKQQVKVEIKQEPHFLVAGQLVFTLYFPPHHTHTFHYYLIPKATGQHLLPHVYIQMHNRNTKEPAFLNVTTPLNKYILITPI